MMQVFAQNLKVSTFCSKSQQLICFKSRSSQTPQNSRRLFARKNDSKGFKNKQTKISQRALTIDQQKSVDKKTAQILERLLNAEDIDQEAELVVDQFKEKFFKQTAQLIYLADVEKDKKSVKKFQCVFQAAQMSKIKQSPPEMQLIHLCMIEEKEEGLKKLLKKNEKIMWEDEEKFFGELDEMIHFVDMQNLSESSQKLRVVRRIVENMRKKRNQDQKSSKKPKTDRAEKTRKEQTIEPILQRLLNAKNMNKEAEIIVDLFDQNFFEQITNLIILAKEKNNQDRLEDLSRCKFAAFLADNKKNYSPQMQVINLCLAAENLSHVQDLLEDNLRNLWPDEEEFFDTLDDMITFFALEKKDFEKSKRLRDTKKIAKYMCDKNPSQVNIEFDWGNFQ